MKLTAIKKIIGLLSIDEFKKLLSNRILKIFDMSFNQTNELNGFTTKTDPFAIEALKMRELILSEKTVNAIHGDLKFQLLEGIQHNESITELTNRLSKIIDLKRWEIERIARTETLYSLNSGEFHSQVASGVAKYKVWKANLNNVRTGADSKRLHNQVQLIDDPFRDPKTGDECQHSPNRPNCRCSIQYLYELPKNIIRKNGLMYLSK